MKVWRFWFINNNKDIQKTSYDLYAITNDKEKAKRFQEERDMSKFIKKTSNEDLDVFSTFVNSNRHLLLDYFKLSKPVVNGSGLIISGYIEVLCTEYERQVSTDESILYNNSLVDGIFWEETVPYMIYKKSIINSLRKLEYMSFYKATQHMLLDIVDDDFSSPDISINELNVFISTFKDTFK